VNQCKNLLAMKTHHVNDNEADTANENTKYKQFFLLENICMKQDKRTEVPPYVSFSERAVRCCSFSCSERVRNSGLSVVTIPISISLGFKSDDKTVQRQ